MEGQNPNPPNETNANDSQDWLWNEKLPDSEHDIVSVVTLEKYVYAGTSKGKVYKYSLDGNFISKNSLPVIPRSGEIRLTIYKGELVVGTVGCVIFISPKEFEDESKNRSIFLPYPETPNSDIVSLIADDSFIYVGSGGYVFKYMDRSLQSINKLPKRGHEEVRLAMINNTLVVGTNGYVVLIDVNNFEKKGNNISLPDCGKEIVSVLTSEKYIYAGSNGYVYKINSDGEKVEKNKLEGVNKSEVRLALKKDQLIVGTDGDVVLINIDDFESKGDNIHLFACTGKIVSVFVDDGYIYAGSFGNIFKIENKNAIDVTKVGTKEIRFYANDSQLFAAGDGYLASVAAIGALNTFDHVVVLMLENRSFDNLLGYLYKENEIPEGKEFEGMLTGKIKANDNPVPERAKDYKHGATIAPMEMTGKNVDYHQPFPDPGEVYQHVNTQLFNEISTGNIGKDAAEMEPPFNVPASGADNPAMNGFVNDYINTLNALEGEEGKSYNDPTEEQYSEIMKCFSPESVNVLSTLAKEFAVFDHWFCSVPSQTWCNRAFWHAATSGGFVINPIGEGGKEGDGKWGLKDWLLKVWSQKNLFNLLDKKNLSATVYAEQFPLTLAVNGFKEGAKTIVKDIKTKREVIIDNVTYKSGVLEDQLKPPVDSIGSLQPFLNDVANKKLPPYAFIEPKFLFEHNDQHPSSVDSDVFGETRAGTVILGEKLIWDVYMAIKNSDTYRDNTLLIITYDENGGCFDHVPPPIAEPPKAEMEVQKGFQFDRLGVRVPMVMVSSHIQKNTIINDVFDHTSFIKTMCEKWGMDSLTDRDRNAKSFAHVFSPEKRTSFPDIPEPKIPKNDAVDYTKDPLNDLQKSIVHGAYHMARLTNKKETVLKKLEEIEKPSQIKTVGDALNFLEVLRPYIVPGEF